MFWGCSTPRNQATVSSYNLGTHPFPSHTWNTNLAGITVGVIIKPPTSLLVLASTRRHANRDTRLKPTGDFACRTHSELNPLISCQCVFWVATEPPKTCNISASSTFALKPARLTPALDPTHSSQHLATWLPMTQVTSQATAMITSTVLRNIPRATTPTTRITEFLTRATTLSTSSLTYYLTLLPLEGEYCSGTRDLAISNQQTHHRLTSCMH